MDTYIQQPLLERTHADGAKGVSYSIGGQGKRGTPVLEGGIVRQQDRSVAGQFPGGPMPPHLTGHGRGGQAMDVHELDAFRNLRVTFLKNLAQPRAASSTV